MKEITEVFQKIKIDPKNIIPYGRNMAKLDTENIKLADQSPKGHLILVTAMSPTPQGEGKRRCPQFS